MLVDDELVHSYGESRRSSTHTPSAVLWVVTGPSADEMAREPGLRKIASWDPLPGPQRWAQISRMAALGNQLEAAGRPDLVHAMRSGGSLDQARGLDGVDQELLDEVEQARRRGDQVAVFVEEQPWGSGN